MTLTRLQRLCGLYNWIAQREALPCPDNEYLDRNVLTQVRAEIDERSEKGIKYNLDDLQDITEEILNAEIESPWHMATKLQIFL